MVPISEKKEDVRFIGGENGPDSSSAHKYGFVFLGDGDDYDDVKAINFLLEALHSKIFDVRWDAVMAIAEISKMWIMWDLVRYLGSEDEKYLDRIEDVLQILLNK